MHDSKSMSNQLRQLIKFVLNKIHFKFLIPNIGVFGKKQKIHFFCCCKALFRLIAKTLHAFRIKIRTKFVTVD